MTETYLRFDFPGVEGLCFRAPERLIVARRVEEILPALAAVEAGVAEGLYAAGFLAYEAAPAFDPAFRVQPPRPDLPLLWFGLFDAPVEADPEEAGAPFTVSPWRAATGEDSYAAAIRRIRAAIAAGETYQVNHTIRLHADVGGSDPALYHRLRRAQGAGYHAYLNTGRYRILSASPELFFHWKEGRIVVRPMKGTAARGRWPKDDDRRADALRRSEKDRAENVMIVDMMRSDLGRVAVPGSVRVDRLFDVETYPTLHQMTSTISARTVPGATLTDVLSALFPSGSVTGAPKVNTVRWISELETAPRGVYCGAIGYIRPGGESVFSVPIRTLLLDTETGTAEYGVGGGVTWDSTREGEYAEAWLKARVLTAETPEFDLLETLLLEDGAFRLLDRHLARLSASARYFGFVPCGDAALRALAAFADAHPTGRWRARLTASRAGCAAVSGAPVQEVAGPHFFDLAAAPVASENRFLYHKTTFRGHYAARRADHGDAFDVLLWNERGEITEFTTGNVILEIGGERWTPPVESGLLAGTFRAELLETGEIAERTLTRADARAASRVWYINGVRGWVEVFPRAGQA